MAMYSMVDTAKKMGDWRVPNGAHFVDAKKNIHFAFINTCSAMLSDNVVRYVVL
jgi:hypothetical protein